MRYDYETPEMRELRRRASKIFTNNLDAQVAFKEYIALMDSKKKDLTDQKVKCCFVPEKECEGLSYCGECIGEAEEE